VAVSMIRSRSAVTLLTLVWGVATTGLSAQCNSFWPFNSCYASPSAPSSAADAAPDKQPPPDASQDSYVIGTEETLRITVWQEPELSETLPVRPDGKISLPLLNDVQATGLTPMELAASITERLKKYVDDPRVTVAVSRVQSRHVYMVGEVLRRGPMSLTPNMTVLQALVTAGLTPFANTKKIYVLRVKNGSQQRFSVNYKPMIKGKNMSQNIFLEPEDMVIVP